MSHGKIRHEKDCLNCGHYVEEKFCPNCGQENTEPRKPFHYLFTHFFEDLTHYDGQFWGTIKNLLFKPGKLTNTYLEGKRQMFVPPVKLYIFVSFVTFLLIAFSDLRADNLIKFKKDRNTAAVVEQLDPVKVLEEEKKNGPVSKEDSILIMKTFSPLKIDENSKEEIPSIFDLKKPLDKDAKYKGANNIREYDSIYKNSSFLQRNIERPFAKKYFEYREQGVPKAEIINNFTMTFFHTIPKALFIYMPLFALILWLFHSKKKWWYFDHGVFTLHYFSFLLLVVFFTMIISKVFNYLPENTFFKVLSYLIYIAIMCYSVLYFYIAHHRVYKTSRVISILVGSIIFILNFITFEFLLIILILISALMMH